VVGQHERRECDYDMCYVRGETAVARDCVLRCVAETSERFLSRQVECTSHLKWDTTKHGEERDRERAKDVC